VTWSLQFNAAGKTGIQIHDRKCNPTAHTVSRARRGERKKKKKRETENKKRPGEVIYHIV